LAHPKWGQLTQASRIVSQLIRETVQAWGGQMKPPAPVLHPVPR
jgi:LysR family nitrogen assimilation transcriptional regulator